MKKNYIIGQSTIEYTAIAMFIVIGILGAGPHVIRSVNSYFKSSEEQAQDSFREVIDQAQIQQGEHNFDVGDGCVCAMSDNLVCGNGGCCAKTQKMKTLQCRPATCRRTDMAACSCSEETLNGRIPFTDADSCFPDCTEDGYKLTCPVGTADDLPSTVFGNCGYECCEDAVAVGCGTRKLAEVGDPEYVAGQETEIYNHEGKMLMMRKCGPGVNPAKQYFWVENHPKCSVSCGDKDDTSDWCNNDPKVYNINLAENGYSDGYIKYVAHGDCSDAYDACVAAGGTDCLKEYICLAECADVPHLLPTDDESACECDTQNGWFWDNASKACENCEHTIQVMSDNSIDIYESDADGNKGNLLFSQVGFTCGQRDSFTLRMDQSGTTYLYVELNNSGGPGGIHIEDATANVCATEVSAPAVYTQNTNSNDKDHNTWCSDNCWIRGVPVGVTDLHLKIDTGC